MPLETQFGAAAESTYGTAVTVDTFFEYESEGIRPVVERINGGGMRPSQYGERADKQVVNILGHHGPVELKPLTSGFGFWLNPALGTVTTAAAGGTAYLHTANFAPTNGDSVTCQVNRYDDYNSTNEPFTYEGGKVSSVEFSMEKNGVLMCTIELDFEALDHSTSLETASYPTTAYAFQWADASVSIGGSSVDYFESWRVTISNNHKEDRHHLRGSAQKKEPLRDAHPEVTWELTGDAEGVAQFDKVVTSTQGTAQAALVLSCAGPVQIDGNGSMGSFIITMPAAQWDDIDSTVGGAGLMMQTVSGTAKYDGSTLLSIQYESIDATP